MTQMNKTVAIIGASGYAGGELLALMDRHPRLGRVVGVAGESAGKRVADTWPRLFLRGGGRKIDEVLISLESLFASPLQFDAVFLCLPHGASVEVPKIVAWARRAGTLVFDVGDSLRLAALSGESELAYGLPELFEKDFRGARVFACAGCYPTSVLLATVPLVAAGALDLQRPIIVDAKSGASGAGRKAQMHLILAESYGNVTPYKPGRTHRHVAEMEAALARVSGGAAPRVLFTPHLLPLARGLFSTLHLRLAPGFHAGKARALLTEHYAKFRFVDVLPQGSVADIALVAGSPGAAISVHGVDDDTSLDVVIVSALDNLLKGAASQALQTFNSVLGFNESEGLI
jgi:N-acetyl-gamma-glutamyl-phosphate reductase